MVARANYLAQGRLDIQYAVKELSRAMALPTESGLGKTDAFGQVFGREAQGSDQLFLARTDRDDNGVLG